MNINPIEMKNYLLIILITVALLTNGQTETQAQTTFSDNEIAFNSHENNDLSMLNLEKINFDSFSMIAEKDLNDGSSELASDLSDHMTVWTSSSSVEVYPSSISLSEVSLLDDFSVNIKGGIFGNGWDITSVTINGVEVRNILMQSSKEVVVIPNEGKAGTGDIVITSKSLGKITIKNSFTYKSSGLNVQAENSKYSNIDASSGDISRDHGN